MGAQRRNIYQPRFHEYLSASLAPQIGDSAAEQCAKNSILGWMDGEAISALRCYALFMELRRF